MSYLVCLFVSVDREGQFAKQAFAHVYRALKLIYSKETPKSMQRDTVSLETQVGHHWHSRIEEECFYIAEDKIYYADISLNMLNVYRHSFPNILFRQTRSLNKVTKHSLQTRSTNKVTKQGLQTRSPN